MNISHNVFILIIIFLSFIFLIFTIRGDKGKPIYFQKELDTKLGGPFEASNSTSRYALTQAIVLNKTFILNPPLAKFASPDVIISNKGYISIFTPGVSFIGIPFYILGNKFGMPQIFTYLSILIIAILNVILIFRITHKLGAGFYVSIFAGLVFLFGTDALPYAQTFTQHQASVLVILLGILNMLEKRTILNNILFGILLGASILIDVPNIFFMTPIFLYILSQHIKLELKNGRIIMFFKLNILAILIGMIPLIALLGWYNYLTSGSYLKLAQTGGQRFTQTTQTNQAISKKPESPTVFFLPFNPRYQLNGFYTLMISNERAWFYYSPIILLGIIGMILLYKNKNRVNISIVLSSIVLINIIVYSMFSDPWGGWSFGPRYLIPSASILSVFLGITIEKYKKNIIFITVLFIVLIYSVFINSLGTLTTASIPPKQEAEHLINPIPYTYDYNLELLNKNFSSSLVYKLYIYNIVNPRDFLYGYVILIILMFGGIYYMSILENKNNKISI